MSNLIGCVESNYFDNSYFGIHRQQCFFMDPMHRLALEGAFSALLDAGKKIIFYLYEHLLKFNLINVFFFISNFTIVFFFYIR